MMNAPILLDTKSVPHTAPIHLSVHLAATLNITAEQARLKVNQQAVTALGTGLIAREPELVIVQDQIIWRVPIILSLPSLGDLGQVGTVDVDARTGDLILSTAVQERIIQHAHRLYTGATLQTP